MPKPLRTEPLDELRLDIVACSRCELGTERRNAVPGAGGSNARIMLIGEAPGQNEDATGEPFVGKAGQRLDEWLAKVGIDRDDCFTTNVLKCVKGSTLVRLPDGSTERIRDLVKRRYDGEVLTVDSTTGAITTARVTGWHRSKLGGRRMFKLHFKHGKGNPRGPAGVHLTEDHKVLTRGRGWVPAADLTDRDLIATGDCAPGSANTEQIILGTVLGDGCVTKQLQLAHSTKQSDWLFLKGAALSGFGGRIAFVPQNDAISFFTKAGAYWRSLRSMFYRNGEKVITEEIAAKLGPLGFAVLFCDDGYLRVRKNRRPTSEIATNGFSATSAGWLAERLRDLGVEVELRMQAGWRIKMRADATIAFAKMIAPFVPPSMRYKLHSGAHGIPFDASAYAPISCTTFWDTPILEESSLGKEKSVFCIDVEGTHAFVTPGGVVHNCKPPWNRFPRDDDPHYRSRFPPHECWHWLAEQLRIVDPLAVVLLGKHALRYVLLAGTSEMAEPVTPWIGRLCRRRDRFGEVRFGVAFHPAYILRAKNPYEEERCIDALLAVRGYVDAVDAGRPAPVDDLYEVRAGSAIQYQRRLRLFGDGMTGGG